MSQLLASRVDSPDLAEVSVFGSVIEAYNQEGFEQGYRRARHDLLETLVFTAESFLDDNGNRPLRNIVYSYIARLEAALEASQVAARQGYVDGGLGI